MSRLAGFLKKRSDAIAFALILTMGVYAVVSSASVLIFGQMPSQGAAPKLTFPKKSEGKTGRGRRPSANELYRMFFTYVAHVAMKADAYGQSGRDVAQFRNHLQRASGLTPSEYADVLSAAKRYYDADVEVRKQMDDWTKAAHTYTNSHQRLPKDIASSLHGPARAALLQRTTVLKSEIALLGEELGQTRSAVLLNYLNSGYLARTIGTLPAGSKRVGPSVANRSTKSPVQPTRAASSEAQAEAATDIVLDSDWSCDDDDFSCADAQIAYVGPGGEVDLYANVDYGDTALELDEEGDIDLYTVTSEGDLSSNGGAPVGYCSDPDGSCDGAGPLTTNVQYDWDSTATVYYWALCEDGSGEDCEDYIDFTAEVNTYIPTPDVNQVLPADVSAGASGSLTIDGEGLISPFGNQPTVTIADQTAIFSSFSVQSFSMDDGTVTMNYQVVASPTTGTQTVTVNNGFGSGEGELTVNAADPVISSIVVQGSSDNNLDAGSTQTVVLTGITFGTGTPVISTAVGGSYASFVSGSTKVISPGKSVSFQVTVPITAPQTPVAFQLQANDGASNPTGDSPSVGVDPYAAPVPVIYDGLAADNGCKGTAISNPVGGDNTQNVYVGQLVQFTGCIPANLPPSISITSMSWSVNDPQFLNKTTLGFSLSAVPAPYLKMVLPSCSVGASCDFAPNLFFLAQGTFVFTYTYTLSNLTTNTASASYQVSGPVPNGYTISSPPPGWITVCEGAYLFCADTSQTEAIAPRPEVGGNDVSYLNFSGITFSSNAAAPESNSGAYQLIQVLQPRNIRIRDYAGTPPCQFGGGLDNTYPYQSGEGATDAPAIPLGYSCAGSLDTGQNEISDSFHAAMYLLWDPSLNASGQSTPGCAATELRNNDGTPGTPTPSTCTGSIPAPLASISWGYCGDAIDTLKTSANGSTWVLNCNANVDDPLLPTYQDAESFDSAPSWTTVHQN